MLLLHEIYYRYPRGNKHLLIRLCFFVCDITQNHLIVKVPSYQDPDTSSSVCVGIYVVTNAGRSNDTQPFTYSPDPGGWLGLVEG